MKEVKSPKKPLLYYYGIVLLIIALFNLLVTPLLNRRSIEEVDYGTFMSKIESQQIEKVEIDDDEIYYTEKGGKTVYCTGIMDDPGLTERLYASGATFSRDVQKTMSPLLSFFLTSSVPLLLFLALGRYVGKKLVEQAGGTVVGRMAVLAEGAAQQRDDIIYLEGLPVFNPDGTVNYTRLELM